jgi:hypothetical protein
MRGALRDVSPPGLGFADGWSARNTKHAEAGFFIRMQILLQLGACVPPGLFTVTSRVVLTVSGAKDTTLLLVLASGLCAPRGGKLAAGS